MNQQPVCISHLSAAPRIVKLQNQDLFAAYVSFAYPQQQVFGIVSKDHGVTWSSPEVLINLPIEPGRWMGQELIIDDQGSLHLFLLNDAQTRVVDDHRGEGEIHAELPQKQRLDIWHVASRNSYHAWQTPKRIWQGYCGSLNSVLQMRNGRLVLPFSYMTQRTWSERGTGLDAFWFVGVFECTTIYSDDRGEHWQPAATPLKVQTPCIEAYGACEPVVIERLDGQLWMLIRTQLGHFYQSFSRDGDQWSRPEPTTIISSDSPAGLLRLADKRLVLLCNECLRYPYALGGRHVIHAAISGDDGKTWQGHREIIRDPLNIQPPPPRGDYGTAYPFPVEASNGNILVSTGQGSGRIKIISFAPDWLCQREQQTDFSAGLDDWSCFTCQEVKLIPHPQTAGKKVLSLAKTTDEWPATAIWNFPKGQSGMLRLKLACPTTSKGLQVILTDHFSVPFDPEDAMAALYVLDISSDNRLLGKAVLSANVWSELTMTWNVQTRLCDVLVNHQSAGALPLLRSGEGVCYVRLKAPACTDAGNAFLIEQVGVTVTNTF